MKLLEIDDEHRIIMLMKAIKHDLSNEFREINNLLDNIKFAKYISPTQLSTLKNFYGPKFDKFEQQLNDFISEPNFDFSKDSELEEYRNTAIEQLAYLKKARTKLGI